MYLGSIFLTDVIYAKLISLHVIRDSATCAISMHYNFSLHDVWSGAMYFQSTAICIIPGIDHFFEWLFLRRVETAFLFNRPEIASTS